MGTDEVTNDLNQVDNSIWYVCKYCRRAYQHKHQLIEHKKTKHYELLLQASNEKKLAKKNKEDDKDESQDRMDNVDNVSATATCRIPSELDEQPQDQNIMGIDISNSVANPIVLEDSNSKPTDDNDKTMSLSLQSHSLSIESSNITDLITLGDMSCSENLYEDRDNNTKIKTNSNFNSKITTPMTATATYATGEFVDAGGKDIEANEMGVLQSEKLYESLSSELQSHIQNQSLDPAASLIDESDSEIECVFDSHRPLGSPMKPLSPTPVTVHANTSATRTCNFKGAFTKFLPPVPMLSDSCGHENTNSNEHTANIGSGSGSSSRPESTSSRSEPVKREFLSLSSSDYKALDSTKEIIAKLEVLGEHHYCRNCFKMFLRPSSYKAHCKICHLKTVSSFNEFKTKFQIEVLPPSSSYSSSLPQAQVQRKRHIEDSYTIVPNFFDECSFASDSSELFQAQLQKRFENGSDNDGIDGDADRDHVLVKIPQADQMKVTVSQTRRSTETSSPSKIRKIDICENSENERRHKQIQGPDQTPIQNQNQVQNDHQYTCKLCGSSFESKSQLTSHLLVHMSMSSSPGSQVPSKKLKPSPTVSEPRVGSGQIQSQSQRPTSTNSISPLKHCIDQSMEGQGRTGTQSTSSSSNKCKHSFSGKFSNLNIPRTNFKSAHCNNKMQRILKSALKRKIFYKFHTRGKPFSCPVCSSYLKSKSKFCLHMTAHRRPDADDIQSSNKCGNRHDSSCVCKLCFKNFYKFEDLQKHLRNHTFSPVPMDHDDDQ